MKTLCKRGHLRVAENLRSNGYCVECNRMQGRVYQFNHREKAIFHAAKRRCMNPQDVAWKLYGGRGIQFRFETFNEFLAELGPRPDPKLTLERKDNDGHYEPGNVKWATAKEQAANRRAYPALRASPRKKEKS